MGKFLKVTVVSLALCAGGACSMFREDCKTCDGTGSVVNFWGLKVTCPDCDGKGYVKK
jgi:DnaJ-class molecular chaperone